MKKKLLIIGAGGHGKVVADIAMKLEKWQSTAFLDNDETIQSCMGLDVIGNTDDAIKFKEEADFFVAIGNNATREKVQEDLLEKDLSIVTLMHPQAVLGSDVEVGLGTVVMAGVVINSSTTIGRGCIINTSSSLDHDNQIEDYVHISPGTRVAGTVSVGKRSWLGIGSVVSNNVTISKNCTIGAGSLVLEDITVPGTYVGVPVRRV